MLDNKYQKWAMSTLQSQGHIIKSFTEVRVMPWSQVYRLETETKVFYLKHMAEPFAVEAKFLDYGSQQQNTLLPHVIALNSDLACFLMIDHGTCLRPILQQDYQEHLVAPILSRYARMQKVEAKNIDALFDLSLPDWRLYRLPELYLGLLEQKNFLLNEGLSEQEIAGLQSLQAKIQALCTELATYPIPETIEHGDFQDNNLLVKKEIFCINDWGDAVITHPFFSLVTFLDSARRNHGIEEDSPRYCRLRDAYIHEWLEFGSQDQLLTAFALAKQLGLIKFALSFYRVALCPGMEGLGQYQGSIAQALRKLLEV